MAKAEAPQRETGYFFGIEFMHARQRTIVDMLQKRGRLDLHLTALELGVSDMTVRRDFR